MQDVNFLLLFDQELLVELLLHDDLEDELKVIVHNWLNEADYISSVQNESSISKIVQISLENVYPETIIINNEIININVNLFALLMNQ